MSVDFSELEWIDSRTDVSDNLATPWSPQTAEDWQAEARVNAEDLDLLEADQRQVASMAVGGVAGSVADLGLTLGGFAPFGVVLGDFGANMWEYAHGRPMAPERAQIRRRNSRRRAPKAAASRFKVGTVKRGYGGMYKVKKDKWGTKKWYRMPAKKKIFYSSTRCKCSQYCSPRARCTWDI
jgi:hypothetical protein